MTSVIKGVNLGGWLVLERWMTPSIFKGTTAENEYELSKIPEKQEAIRRHHDTFITESDFLWLKKVGIQAVRVPIGFWALQENPPYQSVGRKIDWLFSMAQKYNIKVVLCLHAAPGAQNNNDHSGSGTAKGFPGWFRAKNRRKTSATLQELAMRYGQNKMLWGIELLNEPHVPTLYHYYVLRRWNASIIKTLRTLLPRSVAILVSDAYQPSRWSGKIKKEYLDIHHYQCFLPRDQQVKPIDEQLQLLQLTNQRYSKYAQKQPIVIGEWSATLPRSIASEENCRMFCHAELHAWQQYSAWFFWSYKTESNDSWNFRYLQQEGYFDGFL